MRKKYVFNEDREGFGKNLKLLMKQKNCTIEDLTNAISPLDNNTVVKWRAGKRIPSLETLKALAEYFGITVQELYLPNSLYKNEKSDSLDRLIKDGTLQDNDHKTIEEARGYFDYLMQKMLYSFLSFNEEEDAASLFHFWKVTKYGREKLNLKNESPGFYEFYENAKEYVRKQYGLGFPYKNTQETREELLKEYDKWLLPVEDGAKL